MGKNTFYVPEYAMGGGFFEDGVCLLYSHLILIHVGHLLFPRKV